MTKKKYPEEIYPETATQTIDGPVYWISHRKDYECAYDRGFEDGRFKGSLDALNPLAGWSNLTEAIKAGERIDWERLDGLEAQCVHPELGTLTYKLERDAQCPADDYTGWYILGRPDGWPEVFFCSWKDTGGWSLWVKGDLPLRKQTADQLEPGTCFKGKWMGEVRDCLMYQEAPAYHEVDGEEVGPVYELKAVGVNIYPQESREGASTSPVNWLASQVEVLQVYGVGTFEMPEGDA